MSGERAFSREATGRMVCGAKRSKREMLNTTRQGKDAPSPARQPTRLRRRADKAPAPRHDAA